MANKRGSYDPKTGGKGQPGNQTPRKPSGLRVGANIAKIAGNVASTVSTVLSLIEMIKQHPEWYTHYDTANFIAMNLAFKQNVPYRALEQTESNGDGVAATTRALGMPAIASVVMQMTIPQGDQDGWKTGIRLLYQQLRTANAGKVNYFAQDVEKYVWNVAQLHAINAFLQRTYELTYTFRSTNAAIPEQMLNAAKLDCTDMLKNAADLLMYCQRFMQQCGVSFPSHVDLNLRREWMFGNIFVDSNSHKPSFYVTSFSPTKYSPAGGGLHYYTSSVGSNGSTQWNIKFVHLGNAWDENASSAGYMTYAELVAQCEAIKNDLLDDRMMAVIAGDWIKTFGDKGFGTWHMAEINDGAHCIYDESALSQWQNANAVGWTEFKYYNPTTQWPNANVDTVPSIGTDGWAATDLSVWVGNAGQTTRETVISNIVRKSNKYLVNWHDSKIDPGHVMSITRLIPTAAYEFTRDDTYKCVGYKTFGTEVVENVFVLYQRAIGTTDYPLDPNVLWVVTAGTINVSNTLPSHAIGTLTMLWANFDWAPRFRLAYYDQTGTEGSFNIGTVGSVSVDILGWDVFAEVDENILVNYFSYGNQSLLYGSSSQNQSNSQVYEKQQSQKRGNKTGATKFSARPRSEGDTTPPQAAMLPADKK